MSHVCNFLISPSVVVYLTGVRQYRSSVAPAVRKKTAELLRGPLRGRSLVWCPNHLTLIDSYIVAWLALPWWRYVLDYRLVPWNVPEETNFAKNPVMRFFFEYLNKCIMVRRGGVSKTGERSLRKIELALQSGDSVCVFPEAGRSRTGRVDAARRSRVAGRLLLSRPDGAALLVYARGRGQASFTNFPKKGEDFYVDVDYLTTEELVSGLPPGMPRSAREKEVCAAILRRLEALEEGYFAWLDGGQAAQTPVRAKESQAFSSDG